MRRLTTLAFSLLFIGALKAQVNNDLLFYDPEDRTIFYRYMAEFSGKKNLSNSELLIKTAEYFLGTPYVNFTLEATSPNEKLIINLRELDCTTYTETVLALVRTLKSDTLTFEKYADELRKIRFRGGVIDGFVSRLHYFSDWIYDNERMGIVKNLTRQAGGRPLVIDAYLMSRVSRNYRQLVADSTLIPPIREIEQQISARRHYYIPKNALRADKIQDGDILAMNRDGRGIGITHMGFAVKKNGVVYFMHASSTGKRVMITEEPFVDYLARIRTNRGFMIVRPVF